MTTLPRSTADTDDPEAIRALDAAYDFVCAIGRRVLAERRAREAADDDAAPAAAMTTPAKSGPSKPKATRRR